MCIYPVPFYASCFICPFIYLSFRDTTTSTTWSILCFSYCGVTSRRGAIFLLLVITTPRTEGGHRGLQRASAERMNTDAAYFACDAIASCSAQQCLVLFSLRKRLWPWHVIIFFLEVINRGRNFPKHIPPASAFHHSTLPHPSSVPLLRSLRMHLLRERVRDRTRTMKGEWG